MLRRYQALKNSNSALPTNISHVDEGAYKGSELKRHTSNQNTYFVRVFASYFLKLILSLIIFLLVYRGFTSLLTKRRVEYISSLPRTLNEATKFSISPLNQYDYQYYTIRINTWNRNKQLTASIDHHSQCMGVTQIQVVWCDEAHDPPEYILNHPSGKVVVERHSINSLNERFNIILHPPTTGILSIDDDVIRPCFAIDAGFFRWTDSPDRIVGFDSRVHEIYESQWSYGYLSTSEKRNEYSIVLPRYCFIHRDYLFLYTSLIPKSISETITREKNCEDIAMSFFVSYLTGGKVPLLADYWAVKTQVKLETEKKISSSANHKTVRDRCVNEFAEYFHLKGILNAAKAKHSTMFEYGDRIQANFTSSYDHNPRRNAFQRKLALFNEEEILNESKRLKKATATWAFQKGMR